MQGHRRPAPEGLIEAAPVALRAGERGRSRPDQNGLMPGWRAVRRWLRAHPRIADAILAAMLFAAGVLGRPHDREATIVVDGRAVLLLAAACAVLILRRARPVLVWALTLVIGVLGVVLTDGPTPAIVASFVALSTLASRRRPPVTLVSAAVTAASYLLTSVNADQWLSGMTFAVVGWSGLAAALGAAVQNQRAVVAAAEERAVRAEQSRDEEAQRRVAEERLRIARDLHDVVAHHISVINVQSGVVRHLQQTDPEQARQANELVREASRTALSELAAILGLLRSTPSGESKQPAPSLEQAEELLAGLRQAGIHAVWRVTGPPYPLPALVDLTAYRIVQESLTNAVKHGAGDADVSLEYRPTLLAITVSNSVPKPGPGTDFALGHGLIGMRERVQSVGGRITVGPAPAGRFVMTVELPRELK